MLECERLLFDPNYKRNMICFDCGELITGYRNTGWGLPEDRGMCTACYQVRSQVLTQWSKDNPTDWTLYDTRAQIWNAYKKAIKCAEETRDKALAKLGKL